MVCQEQELPACLGVKKPQDSRRTWPSLLETRTSAGGQSVRASLRERWVVRSQLHCLRTSCMFCRQNTSSHVHFSQFLFVSSAHRTAYCFSLSHAQAWLMHGLYSSYLSFKVSIHIPCHSLVSHTLHHSVPRHLRCLRTHCIRGES